jgi:hypothetical protein
MTGGLRTRQGHPVKGGAIRRLLALLLGAAALVAVPTVLIGLAWWEQTAAVVAAIGLPYWAVFKLVLLGARRGGEGGGAGDLALHAGVAALPPFALTATMGSGPVWPFVALGTLAGAAAWGAEQAALRLSRPRSPA